MNASAQVGALASSRHRAPARPRTTDEGCCIGERGWRPHEACEGPHQISWSDAHHSACRRLPVVGEQLRPDGHAIGRVARISGQLASRVEQQILQQPGQATHVAEHPEGARGLGCSIAQAPCCVEAITMLSRMAIISSASRPTWAAASDRPLPPTAPPKGPSAGRAPGRPRCPYRGAGGRGRLRTGATHGPRVDSISTTPRLDRRAASPLDPLTGSSPEGLLRLRRGHARRLGRPQWGGPHPRRPRRRPLWREALGA